MVSGKGFLGNMTENLQADCVQSRQAGFIQCFLNIWVQTWNRSSTPVSFLQSGSRSAFLSFPPGNSPSFSSGSLCCPLHRSNDGTTHIFCRFQKCVLCHIPHLSVRNAPVFPIFLRVVCRSYVFAVRSSPYILYHTLHIGQMTVCSKRIYNILHFSNRKNVFPQR